MVRVLRVWTTVAKYRTRYPRLFNRGWGERHRIKSCVRPTLHRVRRKVKQKGGVIAILPSRRAAVAWRRLTADEVKWRR
jgi:hypothetical protein